MSRRGSRLIKTPSAAGGRVLGKVHRKRTLRLRIASIALYVDTIPAAIRPLVWMEMGNLSKPCCGGKSSYKNKLDQASHRPVQYALARDAPMLTRSVDIGRK